MKGIVVSHTRKGNYIDMQLSFGEGKRSSYSFITSPEIDAELGQRKLTLGKVGHIRLKFNPVEKEVVFVTYYPIGQKGSALFPYKNFLVRKGVGVMAERLLLKRAEKEFGEIKYVRQLEPINGRVKQLERRWHLEEEIKSRISVREYRRAIREKIGAHIKRH